jgi:thiol:disulfide interchange protein
MSWRHLKRLLTCGLAVTAASLLASSPARAADDFLSVEDAFKVEVSAAPSGGVQMEVAIAPRTHLYRDRLSFQGRARQREGGHT